MIFISIDDNEVTNLRKVCDEVFGEENFIGMFTWQSKKGGGSDNNTVVRDQEYIICYGKSVVSGGFFNRGKSNTFNSSKIVLMSFDPSAVEPTFSSIVLYGLSRGSVVLIFS